MLSDCVVHLYLWRTPDKTPGAGGALSLDVAFGGAQERADNYPNARFGGIRGQFLLNCPEMLPGSRRPFRCQSLWELVRWRPHARISWFRPQEGRAVSPGCPCRAMDRLRLLYLLPG